MDSRVIIRRKKEKKKENLHLEQLFNRKPNAIKGKHKEMHLVTDKYHLQPAIKENYEALSTGHFLCQR